MASSQCSNNDSLINTDFDLCNSQHPITSQQYRFVENFLLIWLDSNATKVSNEYQGDIQQLQQFVNTILLAVDEIEYMNIIEHVQNEKIFIIISGSYGFELAEILEMNASIYAIYVYCDNRKYHEKWAVDFPKIKGVFTEMASICDALRRDIRQLNNDLISMDILPSTDPFNSSFVCSIVQKNFLTNTKCDQEMLKDFLEFCRLHYQHNSRQFDLINKYENAFKDSSSITWYTRECCFYSMLNRALKCYDYEILDKIKVFTRILHEEIQRNYLQTNETKKFNVYHEQIITNEQFLRLKNNVNCLISFNTFLMATLDEQLAFEHVQMSLSGSDMIGVIFSIDIDRRTSSYPFVSLDKFDYYQDTDRYVLFSLNTIFRIKHIQEIHQSIYRIHLIMANDNDKELQSINRWIQEKRFNDSDKFLQLAEIMLALDQRHQAKTIYDLSLLNNKRNRHDIEKLAYIYRKLGNISEQNNELDIAMNYYMESSKILSENIGKQDHRLSTIYGNIGSIKLKQEQYDTALSYFEQALGLCDRQSHNDLSFIASCLFNIGFIFFKQSKHKQACEQYKAALSYQKRTPIYECHLSAEIHSNLCTAYEYLGEHQHALEHAREAVRIILSCDRLNHIRLQQYSNQVKRLEERFDRL